MADVTTAYHDAWLSRQYIGDKAPFQRVYVRKGHFVHDYDTWAGPAIGARISADAHTGTPWQATWTPDSDWIELPGVLEVKLDQRLGDDENGIVSATITADNILRTELSGTVDGVSVLFHAIQRGGLSPFYGYAAAGRPSGPAETSWFEMLARKVQIRVEQGWGEATVVKTWTGLLDKCDMVSSPDTMTLTARCFGGPTLADQRFFGNVKDPQLRQPVTFADPMAADNAVQRGYTPTASDSDASHAPDAVLDTPETGGNATWWESATAATADVVKWLNIEVPQGRYASFYLWPKYAGLNGYLSIYVRPRTDGKPCTFNGHTLPENEWLDLSAAPFGTANGYSGFGTIDGRPYIASWDNLAVSAGEYHVLGTPPTGRTQPNELKVGPDSYFRIHFDGLHDTGGGDFRAGAIRFVAMERFRTADATRNHWVLVDDAADVVRECLRWAGFKEWEVENTGVRLKRPYVVSAGDFLVNAIKAMKQTTGFEFFMKDPGPDDLSIGIPVFRMPRARTDDAGLIVVSDDVGTPTRPLAITDQDLLVGLQVTWDEEPLAYIIRVRGKQDTDGGVALIGFGTGTQRIHFTYRPPWAPAGDTDHRLAGIYKHVVHTDDLYTRVSDCEYGCYLIALAEALESCKGVIEIPAHAGITLDQMVDFVDQGTGMNTRMWVSGRTVTCRSGRNASWKETLEGAMVDTPDVVAVKAAIAGKGFDPED